MRALACVLLLGAALGLPRGAAAQHVEQGRLVLDAPAVWDYGEVLFGQREYYRAISEYRRLLHFFPNAPSATAARLRIAEAYLGGGDPAQAEAWLDGVLHAGTAPPGPLHVLRAVARLDLDGGAPYPLREPHIAAALDDLRAVPAGDPLHGRAQGFLHAMAQPPDLPEKSPWLAAGLSAVLPGAGSAYVGRWSEAALGFFVNAVFIYATVDAFQADRRGLGLVLGTAALTFYGGAIYAAANGAHKYNSRVHSDYLARKRTRFVLVPGPDGVRGVVRLDF